MADKDGLVVGVTLYIHDGERSIWVNGGMQNAVFLIRLLRQCPNVKRVIAINGGEGDAPSPKMMLDGLGLELPRFEAVADEIDVLVECGAQIPARYAERVHANGGRVSAYKFGNAFILDAEKLIAGKGDKLVFNGTKFDAIWTNPQHMATNASYWEALHRCPVVELPHIWEPYFLEKAKAELAYGLSFEYKPASPASIAIYEPNIDVVKLCQVPMLVCDLAYRERPDLIDIVWVTNTDRLRSQDTFKGFLGRLDIASAKASDGRNVCSCESRYNLVWFQAKHANVAVSWQIENALNYAYYELLYGHYPLIHNSPMLPAGIGYYYHHCDAHDGARALLDALKHHDEHADEYASAADSFLGTVHPTYQPNIDAYSEALDALWA